MSDEYRVAKRGVDAEVTLVGQPPQTLRLFLAGQAPMHDGDERPSDLLNGHDLFVPALDRRGVVHFLQRDSILVVEVPASFELGREAVHPEDGGAPGRRVSIYVTLENGTILPGSVEYLMPEGRQRLQDYLNLGERFLVLRHDGQVFLINKSHIARVDAAPGDSEK